MSVSETMDQVQEQEDAVMFLLAGSIQMATTAHFIQAVTIVKGMATVLQTRA